MEDAFLVSIIELNITIQFMFVGVNDRLRISEQARFGTAELSSM